MRVHQEGIYSTGKFSNLLLKLGNGGYPEKDGMLYIPNKQGTMVTTVQELIEKMYPDTAHNHDKPLE